MYNYPEVHQLTMQIMERLNRENIACTVLTKGVYPEELIDRLDPGTAIALPWCRSILPSNKSTSRMPPLLPTASHP